MERVTVLTQAISGLFIRASGVGKLHPATVHFPIVLISLLFFWELWLVSTSAGKRFPKSGMISKGLAYSAAASSVLSCVLGALLVSQPAYHYISYERHLIAALTACTAACAFGLLRSRVESRLICGVCAAIAFVAVASAGYLGGELTYGPYARSTSHSLAGTSRRIAETDNFERSPLFYYYHRRVEPILENHCYRCHGPTDQEANLRLDGPELIVRGGTSGGAIVAGNKDLSLMYRVLIMPVSHKMHMPLGRQSLSDDEVRDIGAWIDAGAFGEHYTDGLVSNIGQKQELAKKFWAFRSFTKPSVPSLGDGSWVRNGIDGFILERLQKDGLSPAAQLAPEKLLRRLSFDTTGLPPADSDWKGLRAHPTEAGYLSLVDRYLASPRFGENWATHWLDLARYSDSLGFKDDQDQDGSFRYRDFVIRSFNEDLPADDFLRYQIAGDLINPRSREALVATGFLFVGPYNVEDGADHYRDYDHWDDMLGSTLSVSLGLNMECARCHNHKYDPISQMDYYGLLIPFANADLAVSDPAHFEAKKRSILKKKDPSGKNVPFELIAALEKSTEEPILSAREKRSKPDVRVLINGNIGNKGPAANFRMLSFYEGTISSPGFWEAKIQQEHHLEGPVPEREILATWLTDTENGVGKFVARVMVDHIWRYYFGNGLVPTAGNWGMSGRPPSHRELLDWLAYELIEHKWSLKYIHRLILTSSTYRLGMGDGKTARYDLYQARAPKRLTAEQLRDTMLSLSDSLSPRMYGPGDRPPLRRAELTGLSSGDWPSTELTDRSGSDHANRRSIYIHRKRNFLYPMLKDFGSPEARVSEAHRESDSSIQQGLFLLNDRFTQEQAVGFADRIRREIPSQPLAKEARARIDRIFSLALRRMPTETEVRAIESAYPDVDRNIALITQSVLELNEFIYLE